MKKAIPCARPGRLAVALLLGSTPAPATVYVNEVTVQSPEKVELYNSGPDTVDVNGWTIQESGSHVIVGAPMIAPGDYCVLDVPGDQIDNQGGFIELLDGGTQKDAVYYGQNGSAPLPPELAFAFGRAASPPTLARAPDAASYGGTPVTPSPSTDGDIWTIDITPTLGSANDAPTPALGSSILLNELNPKPVGGNDVVELYNPGAASVSVAGWVICNGDDFLVLPSGTVPASGYLTVTTPAGFDLETDELVYLFRDDEVRVDQIGLHQPPVRSGMPFLEYCQCFARIGDGNGTSHGYDWFSSGGGSTLLRVVCTLGAANQNQPSCQTTGAREPSAASWGEVKSRWR